MTTKAQAPAPIKNIEKFLKTLKLKNGSHESFDKGACVMEAVAYVAGEPFSDHPACACPVITSFMISWNDNLDEKSRNRLLKDLIPKIIGTRGTAADEETRAWLATDWLARTMAPAFLDLAGRREAASALRALAPLTTREIAIASQSVLENARKEANAAWAAARDAARDAAWDAARDAARDAAWDAARDAARDAAWDAARDAAWDAAWDAARDAAWDAARAAAWDAARDAAGDAAWDAARDAAGDAARDAATKKLAPTVTELQKSALDLVERMIAVTAKPVVKKARRSK